MDEPTEYIASDNPIHSASQPGITSLKRSTLELIDDQEVVDNPRKRMKTHDTRTNSSIDIFPSPEVDGNALAESIAQELQCGCCAGLVYRPVIVSPCQHFFCGRFVVC